MADVQTRADQVRVYLTGAANDGGTQADANAALGAYRSSTELESLAAVVTNEIDGLTVDFVAGANGTGAGTLTAASANTVTWTPPGGSAGSAVTITNGQSKVVEGGGADGPKKYIRISRSSGADLTGAATVTLSDVMNNAVGLDNVPSAEATAGDDEYRCVCFRNEHATMPATLLKVYIVTLGTQRTSDAAQLAASGADTIETTGSFADWPTSGYAHVKTSAGATREIVYYASRTDTVLTVPAAGRGLLGTSAAAGAADDTVDAVPGIRIAKEAPTGSTTTGYAQTIADEDSAPTGRTWNTGLTGATGVDIGTLVAAGGLQFLWVHRQIPAGATAVGSALNHLRWTFDGVAA